MNDNSIYKSSDKLFISIWSLLYYLVNLLNKSSNKSYVRLIDRRRSHIFFIIKWWNIIRQWAKFIEHDHRLAQFNYNRYHFFFFSLRSNALFVFCFLHICIYSLVSLISLNVYAYQWEKRMSEHLSRR
jgi:hypothetical protein